MNSDNSALLQIRDLLKNFYEASLRICPKTFANLPDSDSEDSDESSPMRRRRIARNQNENIYLD